MVLGLGTSVAAASRNPSAMVFVNLPDGQRIQVTAFLIGHHNDHPEG
ncbi:MAG: hypothetical protein JNL79_37380 [Myxococcales bacterium]|nr:hypothetical protein [Myxococcales bacterium]